MRPLTEKPGRRRVAFFDAYPHLLGGAHVVALDLARRLPGHGWDVDWVLPGEGPLADEVDQLASEIPGVSAIRVDAPGPLRHFGGSTTGWSGVRAALAAPGFVARLARQFRQADLIYALEPRGVLLAGPAARLARRRLVWHVQKVSPWGFANRFGSLMADEIVTVSESAAEESPGLGDSSIWWNPLLRRPDHVTAKRSGPRIGCIARLHEEKGLDLLLRAIALLSVNHPDVEASIIGSTQQGAEAHEQELHDLIVELGITERVKFLEPRPDPFTALADRDIYVQPSRREGFPLALAEAMAHGFPVVAADCQGNRELVRDGETGRLVPIEAEAIASGIDDMLNRPDDARQMATRAIEFVETLDDGEAHAARWAELLDSLEAK